MLLILDGNESHMSLSNCHSAGYRKRKKFQYCPHRVKLSKHCSFEKQISPKLKLEYFSAAKV